MSKSATVTILDTILTLERHDLGTRQAALPVISKPISTTRALTAAIMEWTEAFTLRGCPSLDLTTRIYLARTIRTLQPKTMAPRHLALAMGTIHHVVVIWDVI